MKLGIDLGSSTSKIAILDDKNNIIHTEYKKHNGEPVKTLLTLLKNIPHKLHKEKFAINITGTAGMGLSQRTYLPFIQEVIAVSSSVKLFYPNAEAVIELGGEDAKFVYFPQKGTPQMRMNGSCAGGTGAFIEQIATLLNTTPFELNEIAKNFTKKITIASRCGVFAKTDVQAHLNQGVAKEDIAASVFRAVAHQYISTLVAGIEIEGDVLFAGGPLTFFDRLRIAFEELLPIGGKFILPENSSTFVAIGAALQADNEQLFDYDIIIEKISQSIGQISLQPTLEPLFNSEDEYKQFKERHNNSIPTSKNITDNLYIGIDAGSTTSKMVVINDNEEIIDEFYASNEGKPLEVILKGFQKFKHYLPKVKAIFSTGYGEELTKAAFNLDGGIVETFAHYRAGLKFKNNINFILDIGGQDIKAIYIDNGVITDIDLNEACSSGTGSFIESFAKSMNLSIDEFVKKALFAKAPIDLGTRCTVFMNSKVKDALRDGYSVDDIASGLAYSVVKNALYKVIRISDLSQLGENILVQGGTFKNDAVLRAFEKLTNKEVVRVKQAHIMGAYGAALYAKDWFIKNTNQTKNYSHILDNKNIIKDKTFLQCKGCGNLCKITKFTFANGSIFYSGNKCEKYFSNKDKTEKSLPNFFNEKYNIFYNQTINEIKTYNNPKATIGIPLVLEIFEHFPFYVKLFNSLGFNVEISHWTTEDIYNKGIRTITVDNICFPAKIVNGHIENLIEKKVDRIFLPVVQYEEKNDKKAVNSYNCPVVTGYPIVINNVYFKKITIDTLEVSFVDKNLTLKKFTKFLNKNFNVPQKEIKKAFYEALAYEEEKRKTYLKYGEEVIKRAIENNEPLIIIAGRPYHIDPLVNHGLMDQAISLGANVVNEEVASHLYKGTLENVDALTQWSYHNRLYKSALYLKELNYDKSAILQLTSFGCGPDAVTVDEMRMLSKEAGRPYINIKIDEMANLGAVKIRIKSLLKTLENGYETRPQKREKIKIFNKKEDPIRVVIGPFFANIYNEVLQAEFKNNGYTLILPRQQSREMLETGLKYVNNDMCYPAIIVIGDLIYQLEQLKKQGKDISEIVLALSETGGQCRASNYSAQLKVALRKSGFTNVKIGTLNTNAGEDSFKLNKLKMLKDFSIGFAIADAINRMQLSIRPYEIQKGSTDKLVDTLKQDLYDFITKRKFSKKDIESFVDYCVDEFNKIEIHNQHFKRVGIVGEIYLKINEFSNNYIIRWLENKGYEVEQPGFVKFLQMDFFSTKYNFHNNIKKEVGRYLRNIVINNTFEKYHDIVEKRLERFKRYRVEHKIKDYIDENIISTAIQFGEAWLLPLEVTIMAKNGIKHIIALQPWGCISNHIIAKGMMPKITNTFPDVKFLSLDFESGTTNVNIFNRLELFLS